MDYFRRLNVTISTFCRGSLFRSRHSASSMHIIQLEPSCAIATTYPSLNLILPRRPTATSTQSAMISLESALMLLCVLPLVGFFMALVCVAIFMSAHISPADIDVYQLFEWLEEQGLTKPDNSSLSLVGGDL